MKQKEIEYHEELTSETVQYFNKLYQPMQENRKIRSQKRSQELLKPKNASEDDIQIKESPIYLGFLRKKWLIKKFYCIFKHFYYWNLVNILNKIFFF